MTRSRFNHAISFTLLAVASVGLMGCLDEDEPNNGPEEAWNNIGHPTQWWYGDEALSGPNGRGVLAMASAAGMSSERDSWPIHMFNPDQTDSNVTRFEGYVWLNQSSDVSVGLTGYVGPDEDGNQIWEWVQPLQQYACAGNEVICARAISIPISSNYYEVSLEFAGTGDYGFFLVPLFD